MSGTFQCPSAVVFTCTCTCTWTSEVLLQYLLTSHTSLLCFAALGELLFGGRNTTPGVGGAICPCDVVLRVSVSYIQL